MAEIAHVTNTSPKGDITLTWSGVTEADTFEEFDLEEAVTEISVQIGGTFGGATAQIDGSNDGSNFLKLQQMDGTDAEATAADLFSILDRPRQLKPSASGGSSQSLTVTMLIRR